MVADIPVSEVMSRAVITVKKNDTIEKIAQIMSRAKIGGVVVTEKSKIVGIITEKDIMRSVLAEGKDYKKMLVGKVMVKPVKTISPDTDIDEAARLMSKLDIERLPVVKDEKLLGIITARRLVAVQPSLIALMKEKGSLETLTPSEKETTLAGECERCGNYSEFLRFKDGIFLCEDCR